MLLDKNIQITVFKVDNDVFEPIGDLSQFTSLIWPDEFNGYATFELWAPITESNSEIIKRGNVIWCGGENACIIEIVKSIADKHGGRTYHVKGRTLESYLCNRIVWGTYNGSGKASTIMYDIVSKHCINPTDTKRKIPYLVNATDTHVGNQIKQYQKTGGEVYDAIYDLASESDLGFSVIFDPRGKRFIFEVRQGVDRTLNNPHGNEPVVFDTDMEDILSSEYYSNAENYKSVGLVMGEDRGTARKRVVVGGATGSGFNRYELYVDARDLQQEVYNDDGTTTTLTDQEYLELLGQRGNEKLSEYIVTETFDAQIRQFGEVQYVFGIDYVKGDKVTVVDRRLNVQVSARITAVEEDYSDEYALILTFGYSYPTLLQKVKAAAG